MAHLCFLPAVSFVLVGVSAARADVLTVGPSGYATPQAAIDAASDGDVILIDAGVYPGFVIDDKELFVAASQLVLTVRVGASRVENLGAGKSVVLADLRLVSEGQTPALALDSCAGARCESRVACCASTTPVRITGSSRMRAPTSS